MSTHIPLIDFSAYDNARPESLSRLGREVGSALAEIGFMSITNLGIPAPMLQEAFAASSAFFACGADHKMRSAYRSASENFGYQGLGQEHLDPEKPADLKETFTMRDILNHPPGDDRWPSREFREVMGAFYGACLDGAFKVQRVLATELGLEREFFVRCHGGENCTLRLLYYPDTGVDAVEESQMGAGAHSDYGLLTLLFQDDVGGLEVLDSAGEWLPVPSIDGAIVVNSGDMLERWTNGRYRSTVHRVKPKIGHRERYSIAMFVDPDSATPVEVLASCVGDGAPTKYAPITAGEHLQQRLEASHAGKFKP